jgi:hypothetical protein
MWKDKAMGEDKRKSGDNGHIGYEDRNYGQGGGYGQSGPNLSQEGRVPEAKPRVEPSEEFSGGHLRRQAAQQYGGRSEREPLEDAAGNRRRFSEDGFDPDLVDSAIADAANEGKAASVDESDLAAEVRRRLTGDEVLDATDIGVTVEGGSVRLGGSVDSRDDKRRAEDLVRDIDGVGEVLNDLRIQSDRLGPLPGPIT